MFISEESLKNISWQAFERTVCRFLLYEGYDGIRHVGQTGDLGADIIAHRNEKRWLFQVKRWKSRVGIDVVDETLNAMRIYRAQIPAIVSLNGFANQVREHQRVLLSRSIPIQLWDRSTLLSRASKLPDRGSSGISLRPYQEEVIQTVVRAYSEGFARRALIVMATGLGKTITTSEAISRINNLSSIKILIIAHTNEIVYQLERSFWPFLKTNQETIVWNGYERPEIEDLERANFIFACLNTVADYIQQDGQLPEFDIVLIDECHHIGGSMYKSILSSTRAGEKDGPFLIGLTATPWRPDETDLFNYFGEPMVCIDMISGLKKGFLSNVNYKMYTDNINWEALKILQGSSFSPSKINRTLFITEWDDAVVLELKAQWNKQSNPKAIVFCGTIDHAITMRDRINSLGFCNAAAIYSQTLGGKSMAPYERNRILCDFHDGTIDVICAVDILNEGVDVPDVNIIVFQRVTHSRRIFIQQLGRGLRIAPGKEVVTVLDFVSDIRRFAAGLNLKDSLSEVSDSSSNKPIRIKLNHNVSFLRIGGEDPEAEIFLRQWLEDIAEVENAGEDASVLKFPPQLPGGR